MVMLSVFCRKCGAHIEEAVDEQFPPSWLSCDCGARYRLAIDEEEHEYADPDGTYDDDADVSDAELAGVEMAEQTDAPRE